jgi:hypothetical protein
MTYTSLPHTYLYILSSRILLSKEGIDIVFACSKTTDLPANLLEIRTWENFSGAFQNILYARNSTGASTPGPVAVSDWWGLCRGNSNLFEPEGKNLANRACLGKKNRIPRPKNQATKGHPRHPLLSSHS